MVKQAVMNEAFKTRQSDFWRTHQDSWLMIRPDRPFDQTAHRYASDNERSRGNLAMKAWFEYLAAKGFAGTLRTWRGLLKSGQSILVVCDDPSEFDSNYTKPRYSPLPVDFWKQFDRSRLPLDDRHEDLDHADAVLRVRRAASEFIAKVKSTKKDRKIGAWVTVGAAAVEAMRGFKSVPLEQRDASQPLPHLSPEVLEKWEREFTNPILGSTPSATGGK